MSPVSPSAKTRRKRLLTDGVTYGGGTDENYWMKYTYDLAGALVEQ